jgi:dTDP-glucose pyrophosphorylase
MIPIAGTPMVGRVLEMLAEGGCDRFVVVVHPSDHELAGYLSSPRWSANVRIARQPERLGMAHALQCATQEIQEILESEVQDFVLASCDNVYPSGHVASLVRERRSRRLDAVVTLLRVTTAEIATIAVVSMRDGFVCSIVEKPDPADAPSDLGVPSLHVVTTRILECLGRVPVSMRGEREFPDALRLLIEGGGRVGGVVAAQRLTLTRPADLISLTRHYLSLEPDLPCGQAILPRDTRVCQPVRVELGARVGPGCELGPMAVLESGCHVGARSVVRDAVVLRSGTVRPGDTIEHAVVA